MSLETAAGSLFLDFDGVICDSLEECLQSSWLALNDVEISGAAPPAPPFGEEYRALFRACRPYIRSGEDYLVVHEWTSAGRIPGSQNEFDASLAAKGPETMARLKGRLYAVREKLLEYHRALWLSWNPLYTGVAGSLKAQVSNPDVWILSTKKAEFIKEILKFHGVDWPLQRTIYTGTRKKLEIIGEVAPDRKSYLVDDQVDHLDFSHRTCECFLALWGYVTPGAAEKAPRTVELEAALEMISSFPRSRRLVG